MQNRCLLSTFIVIKRYLLSCTAYFLSRTSEHSSQLPCNGQYFPKNLKANNSMRKVICQKMLLTNSCRFKIKTILASFFLLYYNIILVSFRFFVSFFEFNFYLFFQKFIHRYHRKISYIGRFISQYSVCKVDKNLSR